MNEASWMLDARCRGLDTDVFWLAKGDNQQKVDAARTICNQCPVKIECLNWALDHNEIHNVWAGTTPAERRVMQTQRRQLGIAS